MNWNLDLIRAKKDIHEYPTHQDPDRVLAGLSLVKVIASERILAGDAIFAQKALEDIEDLVNRTNYWSAVDRRSFMLLYCQEFVPHFGLVEKMSSLPREVDERIIDGFEMNPKQFFETNANQYFSSLVDRKRSDLLPRLIEAMLSYTEINEKGEPNLRARNPAHMLPVMLHLVNWIDIKKERVKPFLSVIAKHESKIVDAIVSADEQTQQRNWTSIEFPNLISSMYESGISQLAELFFHLHMKTRESDTLVAEMLRINQRPNLEVCQANSEWAIDQNNHRYLLGMLRLYLATQGDFPLLVDPGNKIFEPFGRAMGDLIRDHGAQCPVLAGQVATRYLSACPKSEGFFAKPLPESVMKLHPSLVEGSLQSDLGL